MEISAYLIQAYVICPRQAWLMSRSLAGDQSNDFMAIGRFISEETYNRDKKQIKIGNSILDIIYSKNENITLVEVKKSSKALDASQKQLLYYMYTLRNHFCNIYGEIRIPKEKMIYSVELTSEAIDEIEELIVQVNKLVKFTIPPEVERKKYCSTCSHWSEPLKL